MSVKDLEVNAMHTQNVCATAENVNLDQMIETKISDEEVSEEERAEKKVVSEMIGKKKLSECSDAELERHALVLQSIVIVQWLVLFGVA